MLRCLNCTTKGRSQEMKPGQPCPVCKCKQAVIGINDSKLVAIWPESLPEPICVEHKDKRLFQ